MLCQILGGGITYEEKYVLALLITEIFSHGETSKSDASTGPRRLVHLTKDQGDLRVSVQLNDTFNTRKLANDSEHFDEGTAYGSPAFRGTSHSPHEYVHRRQ